jgi:hypothetical protein
MSTCGVQLAAAVAAATAAAPGGSSRHGRPSGSKVAAVPATLFPAGCFTRCNRFVAAAGAPPRRLAVVVASAIAAPGESDDGQPSLDREVKISGCLSFVCVQLHLLASIFCFW